MNNKTCVLSIAISLGWAVCLVGCRSPDRRYERADHPLPRTGPVKPGPEVEPAPPPRGIEHANTDPRVVKPANVPLRPRLSVEEKHDVIRTALLDLQRAVVNSDEHMVLPSGDQGSDVVKDRLSTRLEELGFNVLAAAGDLPYTPSGEQLDQFRKANECNLAFLLKGSAKEADRFGSFHIYRGEVKGKVLNLTTHQEIASKTIRRKGRRALDEREAARDALALAAADVATYLTDEVARKWEVTSLVRTRLVITDLDHASRVDDVRVGLQRQAGIYYVSLENWDDQTETAVFEVLSRFDVREYLMAYVDELRIGRIRVERVEQHGQVIRADQDVID